MGCGPWGQKESDMTERLSTAQKVKRVENVFDEIMAGNFPNLEEEETDIQVQEAQRVPNKMNPKRPTPRYFIIKIEKNNFKCSKKKMKSHTREPP